MALLTAVMSQVKEVSFKPLILKCQCSFNGYIVLVISLTALYRA